MTTVLIAEDEPEIRDYLGLALSCEGYQVEFARDGEEVVSHLERDSRNVSLLLLDLIMPRKDGFETLKEVRRGWPALPVITLSGSCTPANVATVLKAGAIDFLSKPIAHYDLVGAVEAALGRSSRGGGSVESPHHRADERSASFPGTWAQTCEMLLNGVGASDVPVLLRGETGVGKEVLARRLHAQSKRAAHAFLKLNCAALPSELVESELFGYERGAFTGAYKNTPGKFEMANQGTILLDEIGDMDFKLQAKLLQVLQDREFLRLGAKETFRVDVRVMAATHCDLEKAIEEGRFREDLYYRLNIIEVHVPPLRERKDEVLSLAESFLKKYAPAEPLELTPFLRNVLLDYNWPGNVRELENVMRKFLVMRSEETIAAELARKARKAGSRPVSGAPMWTECNGGGSSSNVAKARTPGALASPVQLEYPVPALQPARASGPSHAPAQRQTIEQDRHDGVTRAKSSSSLSTLADLADTRKQAEREAILQALTSSLWNRKKAAALLRIDYKALLYKMKKLGIGENGVLA